MLVFGLVFQFNNAFASLYQAYGPMGNALTNNPNTESGLMENQEWLLGGMADALFGGDDRSMMQLAPEGLSNLAPKADAKINSDDDSTKDKSESKSSKDSKKKSRSSNSSESEDE